MITIRGKHDGFGAQLIAMMSGIAFAKYHNLEYIHTPFCYLDHTDNDATTIERYEKFLDLGSEYRVFYSLDRRIRRRVRSFPYLE